MHCDKVVHELAQVCVNITPWNAPATISLANAISMLAAGNHATSCKDPFRMLFRDTCLRIRQCHWTPHASEVVIKPPELVLLFRQSCGVSAHCL